MKIGIVFTRCTQTCTTGIEVTSWANIKASITPLASWDNIRTIVIVVKHKRSARGCRTWSTVVSCAIACITRTIASYTLFIDYDELSWTCQHTLVIELSCVIGAWSTITGQPKTSFANTVTRNAQISASNGYVWRARCEAWMISRKIVEWWGINHTCRTLCGTNASLARIITWKTTPCSFITVEPWRTSGVTTSSIRTSIVEVVGCWGARVTRCTVWSNSIASQAGYSTLIAAQNPEVWIFEISRSTACHAFIVGSLKINTGGDGNVTVTLSTCVWASCNTWFTR